MKIAFIGQYNKNAQEIAMRIAAKDNEVFMYGTKNNISKDIVIIRGIHPINLPDFSLQFLGIFLTTVHALFCKYDVVHFQSIQAVRFAWLFKIFKPSARIIATVRGQKLEGKSGEYVACNFSDEIIVSNKLMRLAVKRVYGKKAVLIPDGSDDKNTKDTDSISILGLKDKKYILTFENLCKASGVHYLIEAFKQLEDTAKTTNNFKLMIAGQCSEDADYLKYLHVISQGRDNIIFSNEKDEKTMQQLFSHAYLFVDPSTSGSTKTLILDALGFGLPILVSDIKKNTAVIGENGFTFESKSVIALRDRLAYLLSRPAEVEEMGMSAKSQIQNKFGWDAITDQTLAAYTSCKTENRSDLCSNKLANSSRK